MTFQNVKVGSLPPHELEGVIDNTAARFGRLCEDLYKRAAREIVHPNMDLETLITRSVCHAMRIPVKEEQGESDPAGPTSPDEPDGSDGPAQPEPTFAVYVKDEEDMDDTA